MIARLLCKHRSVKLSVYNNDKIWLYFISLNCLIFGLAILKKWKKLILAKNKIYSKCI